jgi:flagellar L-ring protein FlgH
MMIRIAVLAALLCAVAGCAQDIKDIGKEPAMTPVGAGLHATRLAMVVPPAQQPVYASGNSFWQDNAADLFRDSRAMRVGDVVTVKISIADKAEFDNSTHRKRDSTEVSNYTMGWGLNTSGLAGKHVGGAGSGNWTANGQNTSETKGDGLTSRSESINLLVAAVVTDVLPNGNLVISGKQEVRVNFELRDLTVAGVVRPRDISTDNSISYDKIAEARISYGGKGRVTDVQQPGWGQQLWDKVSPF